MSVNEIRIDVTDTERFRELRVPQEWLEAIGERFATQVLTDDEWCDREHCIVSFEYKWGTTAIGLDVF